MAVMKRILFGFIAFAIVGCAKIVPPDGGEKDTTPPTLLNVFPSALSTNFQSEEIYFVFDEFVQLNDIYNQLIVSPPLERRPEIRIKKKGVLVKLNEKLLPNTTYTFNFGDGVGDLTENNPTKDLIYVVSTGEVIDSLGLSGKVVDAYTGLPLDKVKIMLYSNLSDTMPLKQKPFYFGQTNDQGDFQIGYMASGDYQIFALHEENNNYLYDDLGSEGIGYRDDPIRPVEPLDSLFEPLKFHIAKAKDTVQYVQEYQTDSTGFAKVLYYRRPELPELFLPNVDMACASAQVEEHDTVYFWTERISNALLKAVVVDDEVLHDTLDLKNFQVPKRPLKWTSSPKNFARSEDTIRFKFDRPIAVVDTSLWSWMLDSVPTKVNYTFEGFELLVTTKNANDGQKLQYKALPGTVISREGFPCDTLQGEVSYYQNSHFGSLIVRLSAGLTNDWILELIDASGETKQRTRMNGEQVLSYERLLPDTYKLRLIRDANMNGEWDTVDFGAKTQPEQVINMQEEIKLRSNWEMEVEWNLSIN